MQFVYFASVKEIQRQLSLSDAEKLQNEFSTFSKAAHGINYRC